MRTRFLAFVFFIFSVSVNAQIYKYIEKIPSFSLSAGTSCLVDSRDFGSFFKYYLTTNNGLAFYGEIVALFPPHLSYKEYRLEYGVEIVFFKAGGFSTHAVTGFNYGYWQRKDEFSAYFHNHYHKDNSHFFGGGMDFEVNKNVSFYATWKAYPLIFTSYIEAGARFNIYPSSSSGVKRRKGPKAIIK